MAFDNADEIVLWVRRSQTLQPLVLNDGMVKPSIRITGPSNINWKVVVSAGTNAGTFKLTLQDRGGVAVETYDNLVVVTTAQDFIEGRVNGVSKLPLNIVYQGGGAGNPVNGTYASAGDISYEVRTEGFRTLPQASGQHEIMRYTVDRAALLAGLTPTQIGNAVDVITAILIQAQTKLGV